MHITRGAPRTSRSSALGALATLAATLTAGGCGGGGGTAAGPPLSKPDYIKAADAVCATADAKLKSIPQPTSADNHVLKHDLDRMIPIVKGEVSDLKALTPPSADKATIDSLIALVNSATADAQRARSAAVAGNSSAVSQALDAVSSTSQEAGHISNSYGLNVCGEAN